MSHTQELKELLTEDVIPDIEDFMDELFVLIADKKATDEDKETLEELREMRKEFQVIIEEIDKGELEEEEALGLIEEIEEMIEGEED